MQYIYICCMKKNLEIHLVDLSSSLPLPYADEGIRAGFPSPAQDYMEQAIDLNKELIKHPSSTFYGRVVGDSMKDEGIEEGDILDMNYTQHYQLPQWVETDRILRTDFNDAYPKEAEPGSPGWSGGAMGSGQPALVWAATVDLTSRDSCWQARPIGHSSPDGTDGRIDLDLSQLTSALRIVHRIAVCRH